MIVEAPMQIVTTFAGNIHNRVVDDVIGDCEIKDVFRCAIRCHRNLDLLGRIQI